MSMFPLLPAAPRSARPRPLHHRVAAAVRGLKRWLTRGSRPTEV